MLGIARRRHCINTWLYIAWATVSIAYVRERLLWALLFALRAVYLPIWYMLWTLFKCFHPVFRGACLVVETVHQYGRTDDMVQSRRYVVLLAVVLILVVEVFLLMAWLQVGLFDSQAPAGSDKSQRTMDGRCGWRVLNTEAREPWDAPPPALYTSQGVFTRHITCHL